MASTLSFLNALSLLSAPPFSDKSPVPAESDRIEGVVELVVFVSSAESGRVFTNNSSVRSEYGADVP